MIEKYKGNVLEIGSCPFIITKKLKNKGLNVTGIDIQYEIKDLNVLKCNIEREELPFLEDSFSVVLLMDVFEHLGENPLFSLENIKRVLKKDGVFIISTPNFFRIKNILLMIRHGIISEDVVSTLKSLQKEHGFYGHIREYTMKEMKCILNSLDFEIIEKKYVFGGERNNTLGYIITKIMPFLRQNLVLCCKKK